MKFYEFTYSHMGGKSFPWASGYGPLPEMPFLDVLPDAFRDNMYAFWKVNPRPPGMVIDLGGKSWSDMIGNGLGLPSHFVSERIIRDLNENSILYFRATEMPIASIMAKVLRKSSPPKYYVLEAEPGLEVWSEKVSLEEQIAASRETPRRFLLPSRLKCKANSWNGMDLMSALSRTGNLMMISLYCTDRIKDLAEQKGWTNVRFEEIEVL